MGSAGHGRGATRRDTRPPAPGPPAATVRLLVGGDTREREMLALRSGPAQLLDDLPQSTHPLDEPRAGTSEKRLPDAVDTLETHER